MDKFADSKNKIDFVFSLYPLWITYSGLPQKLGATAWCIYRRLLELKFRFGNTKFFYSLEKLSVTTGISKIENLKNNLNKILEAGLIRYKTSVGRGKAAEFEIIEPINAPLSEEEVYKMHPRLQSISYRKAAAKTGTAKATPNQAVLLPENPPNQVVLLPENPPNQVVLLPENPPNQVVLLPENPPNQVPNKNDLNKKDYVVKKDLIYKKDNNNKNDLSHDENVDSLKEQINSNPINNNAVVVFNTQNLKEYGISGELAERYIRIYAPHYLEEKIEILEYKRLKGEQIRNPGGMLKKAIEEDWQRPEGFSTKTQREEAARAAKEAEEAERNKEKERKDKIRREEETAAASEEWKKTAAPEVLARIRERAIKEVKARFPDTDESLLRVPIRLEENKIIAREFLSPDSS
ncbi:MAG: hypothetical protein AB2L18_12600 [Anaerolineaceae bacterium]